MFLLVVVLLLRIPRVEGGAQANGGGAACRKGRGWPCEAR